MIVALYSLFPPPEEIEKNAESRMRMMAHDPGIRSLIALASEGARVM